MSDSDNPALSASRGDGAPMRSASGALSDRVRSLRLPDRGAGRRSRGSRLPWVLVVLLLGTTAAFGYRAFGPRPTEAPAPDASQAGVPGVSGATAESSDVVLEAKGYIIPAHQIQVSPKVAGEIVYLAPNFEEGRQFKMGEVLARLETVDYEADVNRAKALLAASQQRLEEIEKGWPLERQQAKARLDSAETNMEYRRRESERIQRSGTAASPKERDEARSLFDQAAKSYEEAKKALDLLADPGPRRARVDAAKADIEQAKAELKKAEWRLDNCTLKAPVDGTILTKKAEKGNLVNPVAFNVSASLCEMADLRDLEVDLSIQERDIANVVVGQECRVMPEAFQKNETFLKKHPGGYKGKVSRLMPIADRSKGAIPVRVKLAEGEITPEEEGVYLKPDMGVIVSFKKVK
jgi:multidrug resistance efflux pump